MIPPKIFTVWLSENETMPILVKKCIESQKIPGYDHRVIDIKICTELSKTIPYLRDCLNSPYASKKFCKASDYLRMHYLWKEGGIYLDADVEILPNKNFDHLLNHTMFVGKEPTWWLATSVIGSMPKHPFVKSWMQDVEAKFKGNDDKCFESSMEIMCEKYYHWRDDDPGMLICEPDVFCPYFHGYVGTSGTVNGTLTITPNTIAYHHFMKTWVN
jgi:mannosyltransferase OCH1-like enzyme